MRSYQKKLKSLSKSSAKWARRTQEAPDPDTSSIEEVPIGSIRPSVENDALYSRVDRSSRRHKKMVKSVREFGILEPIVVTLDGYILSGHRRYAAALDAGLTDIPVRRHPTYREVDIDAHTKLLAEFNRQRIKNFRERMQEELLDVTTESCVARLEESQRLTNPDMSGNSNLRVIMMGAEKKRCEISAGKKPMQDAIERAVHELKRFWPVSDRTIHYTILKYPPVKFLTRPKRLYTNCRSDYGDLCDMLTRMRLKGIIPWEAIHDPERVYTAWQVFDEHGDFVRDQAEKFMLGYHRDLMRTQPAHIEVFAEKNTLRPIIHEICSEYRMPYTTNKGFSSICPRHLLLNRFKATGKKKLIILMLTDLDPDGEGIAESFCRSMRDEFLAEDDEFIPIKAALNPAQVKQYKLPPSMDAKKSSSRFAAFEKNHGLKAWELEALEPTSLIAELKKTIDSVLDAELFEHERRLEIEDQRKIEAVRRTLLRQTSLADFGENDTDEDGEVGE